MAAIAAECGSNRFKLFFDIPFYAFNNKVPGEIVLKDEVLDRHVGEYQKDQTKIKIFREKGRLYLQFDAPYLLHAVSENRFVASGVRKPVSIEFKKDKAGKTIERVAKRYIREEKDGIILKINPLYLNGFCRFGGLTAA